MEGTDDAAESEVVDETDTFQTQKRIFLYRIKVMLSISVLVMITWALEHRKRSFKEI